MDIGRVVGTATATVRHPSMAGWKLLVVQPVEPDGRPTGDPVLAVDALGAGIRETVLISSDGESTRELVGCNNTPIRWAVLGIVDSPPAAGQQAAASGNRAAHGRKKQHDG